MLPPVVVRRLVLAPSVIGLTVLAITGLPVLLIVAAAASTVLPGRWRPLRLLRKGLIDEAERAEALHNVMAPKPGGVLAALTNADDADVVFVAHTGVEHMATVLDVWRELPMDTSIEMRWWLVPAAEVPTDRDARIDWLFAWWKQIDDWIAERHDAAVAGP